MMWFLRQLRLRFLYATRDPYDFDGNRALLREIDAAQMDDQRGVKP